MWILFKIIKFRTRLSNSSVGTISTPLRMAKRKRTLYFIIEPFSCWECFPGDKVSAGQKTFVLNWIILYSSLAKLIPAVRKSDAKPSKKSQWTNRERVLFVCSRGVSAIGRHIMKDLITMMPHSKSDTKLDTKKDLPVINELADMRNASKVRFC